MIEETPYIIVIAFIVVFLVIPNYFRISRREKRADALLSQALASGRHEPPSIRPYVDASKCMGSGLCVRACPEKNVIEVIGGTAQIVSGSNCIGHGACVVACPVDAIDLVFGSEKRGIDLPAVDPDFQTNVPGLYIAGELGGMGLIANAVEQGSQAMNNLLKEHLRGGGVDFDLDVVIVGAGPAGLSAGLVAKEKGVRVALLEQEEFGGAIRHYPRQKLVMTRTVKFPGYGTVKLKTLRKEELVELFEDIVKKTGLEISAPERVDDIAQLPGGGFHVKTSKREIKTRTVLLSMGRRGTPRRLGVPGEDTGKVAYRLIDPELYQHQHLMVVGGGDSAVEAAVALSEQPGNRVSLSYRRKEINRPKADNLTRLNEAVAAGRISLELGTQVTRIEADRLSLKRDNGEAVLPNDFVFVFAGGVLPTKLLQDAGIGIQTHHGKRVVAKDQAG